MTTTAFTPVDMAREAARRRNGQFGEHTRSVAECGLGRAARPSARDVDAWLGDARRFTLDSIMHSARGGNDRFLTMQYGATAEANTQLKALCNRERMQGIMVWDPAPGRRGARYAPDAPLGVAVYFRGKCWKCMVTPARLVELTHAWFKSGQDKPLVTPETAADTPTTQANYARMRPFSNRYRDVKSNPGGMRDYQSWWREPEVGEKGLGFMDGDSLVVNEVGFDLLELKGGHGPLEERMKRGQQRTLEAWGKLDGCRAFAIDENGTDGDTSVVEYDGGRGVAYHTTLTDLHDTLCEE